MSWLESRLETPAVAALASTLLHSLWEGAAVALGLAMGLALVLSVARSPRIRYAAACLAMVVLPGGVVVTFAQLVPAQPTGFGFGAAPRGFSDDPTSTPSPAWLVPFWIAGVLIFRVRGISSWMAARLWVVVGPGLRPCRRPSGRRSEVSISPLRAALTYAAPSGSSAAGPKPWPHLGLLEEPGDIGLNARLRTERENCCDDLVVSVTGGAVEYATALTALETRRGPRRQRRYVPVMPVLTAAILNMTAVASAVMALQAGPVRPLPQLAPSQSQPAARRTPVAVQLAQAAPAAPAPAAKPVANQPGTTTTVRAVNAVKPVYPPLAKMARSGADLRMPQLFAPANGAEIRRLIQRELKTLHNDVDDSNDTKEPR